ncbi:MAG: hypothetical protein ACOY58_00650 [Candidatus Micrarchaeota archaeon]
MANTKSLIERLRGRIFPVREAAYTLSDHEGPEARGWTRVGDEDELSYDRYTLFAEAYKAYRRDPRAKNIIETYATYVVGDGYWVIFDSESDAERWEEFRQANDFDARLEEIIRLTLVRGNHFIRIFKEDRAVPIVRHISAADVGEIVVSEDDAETVASYAGRGNYEGAEWPAEEIVHFAIGKLGNYPWGIPLLEPVLPDLTRYRAHLRSVGLLWRIWLSIPLIRKGPWSAAQIKERRNDFAALPPPGTIVTCSNEESWERPAPPNATALPEQSRELRLSIASGVGLPEYMVTSDASQSNYASTLVAEAPAMRRFQALQLCFAHSFQELIRKALEPEGDFDFGFTPLIPRDEEKEIRAWVDVYALGAISWQTFAQKIGLDPSDEKDRMRAEGRVKEGW